MAMTALLVGDRDPRLSRLSRRQGLSAAGDLRHHHRPDRSAALRGDRAAAPARGQPDPLCGLARRRIAEGAPIPTSSRCIVSATPQVAYDAAVAVITKRKWRIVDARAPQPDRRDGRIEAVARTPILGFRDDVVVRVRPDPDGARIDIRSTSRYGRHDFGTNAARVARSPKRSTMRSDELTPEKPPDQVKKAKKVEPKASRTSQAINAVDRGRAFGRDLAARHQVLHVRQHREARRSR